MMPDDSCRKFDCMNARIRALSAEQRVRELTDFVRRLVNYSRETVPATVDWNWLTEAEHIICLEDNCMNQPGNWTPDGRGFCGLHASVMD